MIKLSGKKEKPFSKSFVEKELRDCEKQIKEHLKVDTVILLKEDYDKLNSTYLTLSDKDINKVAREIDVKTRKTSTRVYFNDGTETVVTLNDHDDFDDPEKAVMWCLLKKCFSSKRGLEKVIYSMEEM